MDVAEAVVLMTDLGEAGDDEAEETAPDNDGEGDDAGPEGGGEEDETAEDAADEEARSAEDGEAPEFWSAEDKAAWDSVPAELHTALAYRTPAQFEAWHRATRLPGVGDAALAKGSAPPTPDLPLDPKHGQAQAMD